MASEPKRLRSVEDENAKLQKLVAESMLDIAVSPAYELLCVTAA
jgi:hypothetical protein